MESRFFGKLDNLEHLEGKWFRGHNPLGFYSAKYDITIATPPGFVTDFASVPRIPIAYMVAGNTGHWEAYLHDMLYRFFNERLMADAIFYEAGRVRAKMRTEQSWWLDRGRKLRSGLMAGVTAAVGWAVHSPLPGCLDYRHKKKCSQNCLECKLFYPEWRSCKVFGYRPDLIFSL